MYYPSEVLCRINHIIKCIVLLNNNYLIVLKRLHIFKLIYKMFSK